MTAKYSEFTGNWDDVAEDGFWDSGLKEQNVETEEYEDWEEYDNEDLPSCRHFEKMNDYMRPHGEITIFFWCMGDPGMGGASKVFELPPDRV